MIKGAEKPSFLYSQMSLEVNKFNINYDCTFNNNVLKLYIR